MVGFFEHFDTIERNGRQQKNIIARIDFFRNIKENVVLFEYYNVKDGQKPEDVAYELYNDPELYWILLYINDIVDPFCDWLLSDKRLRDLMIKKYGAENVHEIHHYESIEGHELGPGITVGEGAPFSKAVTNYDYEFRENEKKRQIKTLKRRFLSQVLAEYSSRF